MEDDLHDGFAHADDFLELQLTKGSTKVRIEILNKVQQELGDSGEQRKHFSYALSFLIYIRLGCDQACSNPSPTSRNLPTIS